MGGSDGKQGATEGLADLFQAPWCPQPCTGSLASLLPLTLAVTFSSPEAPLAFFPLSLCTCYSLCNALLLPSAFKIMLFKFFSVHMNCMCNVHVS